MVVELLRQRLFPPKPPHLRARSRPLLSAAQQTPRSARPEGRLRCSPHSAVGSSPAPPGPASRRPTPLRKHEVAAVPYRPPPPPRRGAPLSILHSTPPENAAPLRGGKVAACRPAQEWGSALLPAHPRERV